VTRAKAALLSIALPLILLALGPVLIPLGSGFIATAATILLLVVVIVAAVTPARWYVRDKGRSGFFAWLAVGSTIGWLGLWLLRDLRADVMGGPTDEPRTLGPDRGAAGPPPA
jgi:hypothetical protein